MSQSITASNVAVPFTTPLLQDSNYIVSASWPSPGTSTTTPSMNFPNLCWPTVGKFVIQLSTTAINGTSGSQNYTASLQDSADNVTFTNVAAFASNLLTTQDSSGTASAASVQVELTPTAKQYLRAALGSAPQNTLAPTGSVTLTALF